MGENDWIIGVALSFGSSFFSCLGLIFQKLAHNQNEELPEGRKWPVIIGIVCSPCWWASFIMMGKFVSLLVFRGINRCIIIGLIPFPFDFFAFSFGKYE